MSIYQGIQANAGLEVFEPDRESVTQDVTLSLEYFLEKVQGERMRNLDKA